MREVDPGGRPFLRHPAGPDTQLQPPTGQLVQGRDRAGRDERVPEPRAGRRRCRAGDQPALAVDERGRLGFLYQQVTGRDGAQRWHTVLELTDDRFATTTSHLLADTPVDTPVKAFDPYLGDYLSMMAVARTFFGIFTANNTPDHANSPSGVTYQRNADFDTHQLLANDGRTPVDVSIDPFFFSIRQRAGRLVTSIADQGEFGDVCVDAFCDEPLTLQNAGETTLRITAITSSSPDFAAPQALSYPMELAPGDDVEVQIRFQPTSPGAKPALVVVDSDDEVGRHRIRVHGTAPSPRLSLSIQQDYGAVCMGAHADQPSSLATVGGALSRSPGSPRPTLTTGCRRC